MRLRAVLAGLLLTVACAAQAQTPGRMLFQGHGYEPAQADRTQAGVRDMVVRTAFHIKHAFYTHQAMALAQAELAEPPPASGPLAVPQNRATLFEQFTLAAPSTLFDELVELEPGVLRACLWLDAPEAHARAGVLDALGRLEGHLDFRAVGLLAEVACEEASTEDDVPLGGQDLGVFIDLQAMSLPAARATLRPDVDELWVLSLMGEAHSQVVVLTNAGTSRRSLLSASADVEGLSIESTCTEPVRPGASCEMTVSSDGSSLAGVGTLTLSFDDGRSTSLPLTASELAP